ncbi:MAG: uracil phosphoribosyltransferase [Oscillospiraceae bacterium]|nr:uracil phosphoribosyltransferase [Oscillospiraceae bacterium]
MENFKVISHPLIRHKLAVLRNKETTPKTFKAIIGEIATVMSYEALGDLQTKEIDIVTPICATKAEEISDEIVFVPILRAGLGMVEGVRDLVPFAHIGHIGLYRDESTLRPMEYYCKLPACIADSRVLILDPMLATGGSAVAAVQMIKDRGCKSISFLSIIASKEGVNTLLTAHPDVMLYCAGLDEKLNEIGYIVPGLGDAGDRIFGTEVEN